MLWFACPVADCSAARRAPDPYCNLGTPFVQPQASEVSRMAEWLERILGWAFLVQVVRGMQALGFSVRCVLPPGSGRE